MPLLEKGSSAEPQPGQEPAESPDVDAATATAELRVLGESMAGSGATSFDRADEPDMQATAALDPETGWSYQTRARAEQALYQALDQPKVRGAAYMDQFSCSEGKCRFELGLVQPMSADTAHLVSDFMSDMDARLLADEASSGVQVHLESFRPRADGTGLSVLTIESRTESPAEVTINQETGEATILFPPRPAGDN
ncbi:hypothetical protein [Thioalkalivibrio sp. XN279]|uniref:hypothetical protein n=1 Tax=Thioalkalivibrio sp. XN279 TaxID=2714953 RepID=UPI00140C01E4|nr:hypothetical protein [Thioalkalivibrio sp. XN279]NHA15748.1 hypothetical protein [Thioalkalivibrio sp. XN279]